MKEIPLSKKGKNRGKYVALVSDEDYDFLMQWNWHVSIFPKTNYACRCVRIPNGKTITIPMHAVVLERMFGNLGVVGDHINHNGLHNFRPNLRPATDQQNNFNVSKKDTPSASPFKGVTLDKTVGLIKKWRARIQIGRKMICLKRHATEKEAAIVYDEAAIKYFGEYACLNFPKENYQALAV